MTLRPSAQQGGEIEMQQMGNEWKYKWFLFLFYENSPIQLLHLFRLCQKFYPWVFLNCLGICNLRVQKLCNHKRRNWDAESEKMGNEWMKMWGGLLKKFFASAPNAKWQAQLIPIIANLSYLQGVRRHKFTFQYDLTGRRMVLFFKNQSFLGSWVEIYAMTLEFG